MIRAQTLQMKRRFSNSKVQDMIAVSLYMAKKGDLACKAKTAQSGNFFNDRDDQPQNNPQLPPDEPERKRKQRAYEKQIQKYNRWDELQRYKKVGSSRQYSRFRRICRIIWRYKRRIPLKLLIGSLNIVIFIIEEFPILVIVKIVKAYIWLLDFIYNFLTWPYRKVRKSLKMFLYRHNPLFGFAYSDYNDLFRDRIPKEFLVFLVAGRPYYVFLKFWFPEVIEKVLEYFRPLLFPSIQMNRFLVWSLTDQDFLSTMAVERIIRIGSQSPFILVLVLIFHAPLDSLLDFTRQLMSLLLDIIAWPFCKIWTSLKWKLSDPFRPGSFFDELTRHTVLFFIACTPYVLVIVLKPQPFLNILIFVQKVLFTIIFLSIKWTTTIVRNFLQ